MKAPPRSGFFFSAENRFLSFFTLGLFTVFCLLGLSGISFQKEVKSSSYARTDVAILLDVSRSMLARDAEPARLGKAKQICLDLINGFPARYSLTVFKGAAVTLVPLTEDASALAEGLRFSGPSVLTPPGTDIAGALAAAAGTHASRDGAKKILLLLSDGETVRESGEPGEIPVPAFSVIAVGLGNEEGSAIQLENGDYVRSSSGDIVVTRLRKAYLRELAESSGGAYFDGSGDFIVKELISYLKKAASPDFPANVSRVPKDNYRIFILLAVITMMIHLGLRLIRWQKT